MVYIYKYVFDVCRNEDVYWCVVDIGWVIGYSYIVYGSFANGCILVMYEGTFDILLFEYCIGDRADWFKDWFWDIIERYGVTQFYMVFTVICTFMKWGV